jgi:hypothetical protein
MRVITAIIAFALFPVTVVAVEAPASTPTAPIPDAAPTPAVTGTVARAQFTIGVQDREPVDNLTSLESGKTQVYFYSELKNLAGARITHRWEYNGKVMYEQAFDVGGERWRVWSSKTFDPSWTGEWKVSVVDGAGATLAVQTLTYGAPAQPAAAPATPPAGQPQPAAPRQY